MNANTTPLAEVIPWSPNQPRTVLVSDSIETDGGFVLSTMIAQLFSSHPHPHPHPPPPPSSLLAGGTTTSANTKRPERRHPRTPATTPRALWLSGNSSTERQVAADLKKLGCDAGAAYLKKNSSSSNSIINNNRNSGLSIRSLSLEIADRILARNVPVDNTDDRPFDRKEYLQSVYDDVVDWVGNGRHDEEGKVTATDSSPSPSWIVLDDVTALSSMLGDTLVYCFVESLIALVNRPETPEFGLILRSSGDLDQMRYKIEGTEGTDQSGWFGGGGLSHKQEVHDALYRSYVPWERAIEESVDAIIDVLPLLSGFSREAHGRLIFSETPNGRGWKDMVQDRKNPPATTTAGSAFKPSSSSSSSTSNSRSNQTQSTNNWNKLIFNYRIQDNGARAIRLRAR